MLFAAEERGLFGSRYFVEHSAIPLKNIVAEIQLDMIGRNEELPNKEKPEENTNTVHLVGSQKHSRELHQIIIEQNRSIGLTFEYDMEEVYSRSDQIHFGNAGIPVVFFFTGFHPDYHQPTDTADKVNFAKLARIVRLAYLTAFQLADRPERPRLIKQEKY
jgi:Zn-dependent M28 family amino/carboxypeptidase